MEAYKEGTSNTKIQTFVGRQVRIWPNTYNIKRDVCVWQRCFEWGLSQLTCRSRHKLLYLRYLHLEQMPPYCAKVCAWPFLICRILPYNCFLACLIRWGTEPISGQSYAKGMLNSVTSEICKVISYPSAVPILSPICREWDTFVYTGANGIGSPMLTYMITSSSLQISRRSRAFSSEDSRQLFWTMSQQISLKSRPAV